MTIFVRQSRGGDWGSIYKDTVEDTTFPADVIADVVDIKTGETSIWQIKGLTQQQEKVNADELTTILRSTDEMKRLTAALHPSTTPNFTEVTFRVVSGWRLRKAGLIVKSAEGDSQDHALDRGGTHSIVKIETTIQAIKFAKALIDRPPLIFGQDDVIRFFALALQERWRNADRVHPDIWKVLIRDRYLKVEATQSAREN